MGTLLIVDDEQLLLSSFARVLRKNGVFDDVRFAKDATEVERVLSDASLDIRCVVSDFRMPEWSGFDVLRRAAELQPAARRVIMAADTAPITRALEKHVDLVHAVLQKPFTSEQLIAASSQPSPADATSTPDRS